MMTTPFSMTRVALMSALMTSCDVPAEEGEGADIHTDTASQALLSQVSSSPASRSAPIVRDLEAATKGLLLMSESDYPFDVVYWKHPPRGPIAAPKIAQLTGHVGAPFEEKTLESFFRIAATPQKWHTPEEQEAVRRYQALVKLLQRKLSSIHVYRFGAIDINSYVVGVTADGSWAGLSTIQVET